MSIRLMNPACTFQDVARQRLRRLKQLKATGGPVFRERRRCRDQRFDLGEHVLERLDRDWIDEHASDTTAVRDFHQAALNHGRASSRNKCV